MMKAIYALFFSLLLLPSICFSQTCQITQVTATPLPCVGNNFMVSVNLQVNNPTSPGFTLAGNGIIYGTYLYSDLPVVVGPLLGDDLSNYEFIAWDVDNPACQNYVSIPAANCGPICHFSNFTMEKIICLTNSVAAVTIDFDHQNTSTPTFDLYYENGQFVTTVLYASLPYALLNFTTNGAAPITVKVCDHNSQTCCQTFTVPAIDCNPTNCEIYNVIVDPECLTGNFVVHIDFDVDNPASDSFTVHGNSLNYGIFGYNQLPIVLGPLNGNSNINWDFIIQDSQLPSCTKDYLLGIYHCPPPCDILSFDAVPLLCNGNDAYQLQLDMDIEGKGSQGYSIFSETHYYGTHAYNALPYTIPAFAFSGNIDYVTVCDNQHSGCCATTGFLALNCAGCIIYNLQANPLPCNQQGQFFISIDFDYQNVSSEGFSITGNGMQLGNFNYNQVPILLGPFNGDGAQYFEFVVTDLVNGDCFDATELGTLPCSAICELSNLQVTTGECTGNNEYILHVNFDHSGTVSTGFNLLANGQYFDTYSYSDLPLTILEFPSSANGSDMIQVCDLGNSNCCTSLTFVSPDCQCSIFEITTETLGCTSDTTFAISVEFFSEHLLDNTVDVSIDGIFLGNFSIASIPFTVDNVPEGNTTAILTICGHVENDCCADAVIQLVNCEGPQCSIYNLSTNVGTCTSDTTYILDILFNHANLPVDSVNISANSHFIGKFLAQADSIRIINFPEYEENMTTLTVCAVNKPDCCDQFTFNTPDCTPDDCEVSGLFAVPGLCTSDSTYELVIEYATENIPNDSIILFANGNSIDTLYDPAHHIYIQYFPVSSTDTTIITICAYSFPDCCDTYSFATPSCEGAGPCHLYDLTAEPGSCQPDSTYLLVLNFLFDHLSVDSVSIVANGNNLGNFQVQEGHIVFDHFPVYSTPATTIQVCGSGNPECCDEVTFDTPHCGGPGECSINNLLIHIGDCLTDSTYVLFIDFLYQGLAVDSVLITSDGGFSHLYAINGGHLVLNPFYSPASGATTTLHVCAVGAADCCDESEFETPDCIGGGTCHIYDVTALPGACTSELTYILDFHFWWNNLPTDSVLIYANGLFIGTYHTDPNFIHIDNFPLLGETTNLEICSLGAPDCCGNVTFTNPACGANQCSIFDISVQTFDCNSDSTFGAIINFQYQNVTSTGFDAYTGDQYLGFYTLGQVPIIANQFPANASGEYVITICEHDNFNCCSSFQFEGPVCAEGACDISDFGYTLTNCDSAGNFYFILNFQYHNVGASGFNVVGNGNIYGNFGYDQLPIRIGPFPSDQTAFEFLVLDAENAACFDFIQPGEVQCTVGTSYVSKDEIYSLLNNGTLPVIFAKKDITLTLYNSNGKMIDARQPISSGSLFEINALPSGVYIAFIMYEGTTWPIKLVKGSY